MSKVATNMKSVYELFIEETEKSAPDVDMLESLIGRLQQEDIYKITNLNLRGKKLKKLPNNIGNLTNLQRFVCSFNEISEIPDNIGNLTNLQYFNCHRNKISKIPDTVGNLTNLQSFYCSSNKISEIPNSIGNLINLQAFHCYNNQISELPKWLENMNIPDMRT